MFSLIVVEVGNVVKKSTASTREPTLARGAWAKTCATRL